MMRSELRKQVLASQKRCYNLGAQKSMNWSVDHDSVDTSFQARALYRHTLRAMTQVKSNFCLTTPIPIMKSRIRIAFEINKKVHDPLTITMLIAEGRHDLQASIANMYTSNFYLYNKYFKTTRDTVLTYGVQAAANRDLVLRRSELRKKANAIAQGDDLHPELPGTIFDDKRNKIGYFHPKGPLPAGESDIFARVPERKDWCDYQLPDPWNPKNSPQGPPNPNLITNTDMQYKVSLARMSPYNRHRIKRLTEHEKKTRNMSEFEYLTYFRENEVHYAANEFELPEYEWAEARMERAVRKCKNENQEIFEPTRSEWIEKYKTQAKAVNYVPAIDYWMMSFKQWIPNYDKNVVESIIDGSIESKWNSFISDTGNYAAYRHAAYQTAFSSSQLGKTFEDFVTGVNSDSDATRPYDCPNFRNKWYTDNTLEHIRIVQEDVEEGLGCRNGKLPVLQSELKSLKEEIGCVELTEQRFKGEWWARGNIKLMSTLEVVCVIYFLTSIEVPKTSIPFFSPFFFLNNCTRRFYETILKSNKNKTDSQDGSHQRDIE